MSCFIYALIFDDMKTKREEDGIKTKSVMHSTLGDISQFSRFVNGHSIHVMFTGCNVGCFQWTIFSYF